MRVGRGRCLWGESGVLLPFFRRRKLLAHYLPQADRQGARDKVISGKVSVMSTNFTSEKLILAIRSHLIDVDAMLPTSEATRLASEITEVVLVELSCVGLSREGLEHLFASATQDLNTRAHAQY
jgi:hypothetical protein